MEKENEIVGKLEIGKDYVNKDGLIVIDRLGVFENIGFDGNRIYYDLFCSNPNEWREATKEEVIEAFEKHLVCRYGKDWKTVKIKERHPNSNPARPLNDNSHVVGIAKFRDGWVVWSENGLLYCDGIWVES